MLEIYYEISMLVPLTYIAVVIHLCCIRMFSSLLPFDVITVAMDLRLLMLTVSAEMLFNVLWCDSFGGNFMELLQHVLQWIVGYTVLPLTGHFQKYLTAECCN